MVVAMFFIQNCELHGKDAHKTFTGDMLHCKCFLFSHDDGDDYMVCCIILSPSNLMFLGMDGDLEKPFHHTDICLALQFYSQPC